MKRLLWLFLLASHALSQNSTTFGNITSQVASCSGNQSGYVYYKLPLNINTVGVTVSGTWSATVQFLGSVDGVNWSSVPASPLPSGASVTSTAANGSWTVSTAGLPYVCLYASAYTSGTVAVAMAATSGTSGSGTAAAISGQPINPSSTGATTPGPGAFTSLSNTLTQNGSVATVASATTIAPTTPLVIISGTAAIATITLPSGFTTGCFDILATGAWTTTTAGNIQATMTAAANVQYQACYFGSKWNIK